MIIEDLLSMKLDDNHKLKSNVEKHRNTEFGDEFESFDLFEKTEVQKLRSSKQRKIWKLKRKNVVLGQQRASLLRFKVPSVSGFLDSDGKFVVTALDVGLSHKEYLKLISLSEQIGKNSNKIQRLRTLIQQEKQK